jgi:hypothetical protein
MAKPIAIRLADATALADFTIKITTNANLVGDQITQLSKRLGTTAPVMLLEVGQALTGDIKERITSHDGGRWAAASKWLRAKKGTDNVLSGIEKFLKSNVNGTTLQVYAETDGEWTFTQHDEGFANVEDHFDGTVVEIDIVDPGPLGLSATPSGKFAWQPRKGPGSTPARKIWSTQEEVQATVSPIASRWIEAQIAAIQSPSEVEV